MRKLIVIDHENIIKVFGHIVGLRLDHFILLEYMTKFALSNAKVISSEGINYYWVAHAKAISDMPLVFTTWKDGKRVDCSKRTLRRITADLEKAGLIYKYKDCQKESKSYYGFSDTVISFFSPHVKPRTKKTEGVDRNSQGARTVVADNSKLSNSKLNDSNTLGSTTFFVELFAKLETTYLQQFVEQPSNTWLKKQQAKYTQEQIEEIFLGIEAYCVEHTGYCKKRKNLGRVFTQFAKDLKKDVAVSSYILDAFTIFFKAKGLDLKADKMSKTAKSQMQNITKQVEEHYGTKLNAKRLSSFLSLVKKELWYDKSTKLYTVAYLNNKIAEAIALLPKKKKTSPAKINLQVNEFITTFGREITMDKHNDLEQYALRHRIREAFPFFKGALGAAKFTTTQQVKNVYIAFLKAWASKSYPSDKASVLKSVIK